MNYFLSLVLSFSSISNPTSLSSINLVRAERHVVGICLLDKSGEWKLKIEEKEFWLDINEHLYLHRELRRFIGKKATVTAYGIYSNDSKRWLLVNAVEPFDK